MSAFHGVGVRKTALVLFVVCPFAISTVVSPLFIDLAEANWLVPVNPTPPPAPEISITLPAANETYSSNVGLDFLVVGRNWIWDYGGYINISSVTYGLDDQPAMPFVGEQVVLPDVQSLIVHFSGSLTGLSRGVHSLIVYVECVGRYSPEPYNMTDFKAVGSSSKVYFGVDTSMKDNVPPEISIQSPKDQAYNASEVLVTFTVNEACSRFGYSLDGKKNVVVDGNTTITGLPDGTHSLVVFATDLAGNSKSSVTNFTIATVPVVLIVSPKNTRYEVAVPKLANLALNFVVSEPTYAMAYSLDDNENQSIPGNTTLKGLASGSHSIVVFASDANGNIGRSATVTFTVAQTEPFPTLLVIPVSAAAAAVIAVSVLVYLTKLRRDTTD